MFNLSEYDIFNKGLANTGCRFCKCVMYLCSFCTTCLQCYPLSLLFFNSQFIMIILAPASGILYSVLQQSLILAGLQGTSYISQHKQIHLLCYTSLFFKSATQLNSHCYFRLCCNTDPLKNTSAEKH